MRAGKYVSLDKRKQSDDGTKSAEKKEKITEMKNSLNTSTKDLNTSIKNGLSSTEEKVLSIIKGNEQISITDIATESGLSRAGVQYTIEKLKAKGIIERKGSKKAGRWVIK